MSTTLKVIKRWYLFKRIVLNYVTVAIFDPFKIRGFSAWLTPAYVFSYQGYGKRGNSCSWYGSQADEEARCWGSKGKPIPKFEYTHP